MRDHTNTQSRHTRNHQTRDQGRHVAEQDPRVSMIQTNVGAPVPLGLAVCLCEWRACVSCVTGLWPWGRDRGAEACLLSRRRASACTPCTAGTYFNSTGARPHLRVCEGVGQRVARVTACSRFRRLFVCEWMCALPIYSFSGI